MLTVWCQKWRQENKSCVSKIKEDHHTERESLIGLIKQLIWLVISNLKAIESKYYCVCLNIKDAQCEKFPTNNNQPKLKLDWKTSKKWLVNSFVKIRPEMDMFSVKSHSVRLHLIKVTVEASINRLLMFSSH